MTVVPPEFSVHHSGETPSYLTQIRIESIFVWYVSHLTMDKALIDYVTCNTGTLTHTAAQRKKLTSSSLLIVTVILQRSGSRATFLHFHRTVFTSPVLSSGFPAVLLPFPAVFYKNCTFLVYQPQVTLSSTIFADRKKSHNCLNLSGINKKLIYKINL